MAKVLVPTQCCGVREMSPIGGKTPEQVMWEVQWDFENSGRNCSFMFFTCSDNRGKDEKKKSYGTVLKEFIEKEKLGTVTETTVKLNPNSGNLLQMFMYEPNKSALKRKSEVFGKAHREKLEKERKEREERMKKNREEREKILKNYKLEVKEKGLEVGTLVTNNGNRCVQRFNGGGEIIHIDLEQFHIERDDGHHGSGVKGSWVFPLSDYKALDIVEK